MHHLVGKDRDRASEDSAASALLHLYGPKHEEGTQCNENVADRSSQAQHKGIFDPNKLILSEHTQDYEQVPERKRTIPDDLGWDGIVILFDDYSPTGYQ
jgi:hypothetical protein